MRANTKEGMLASPPATRALSSILALNYGARAELVDAVNSILEKASFVTGSRFTPHRRGSPFPSTSTPPGLPDPDLRIRTSGEMRVSNFLLRQIAYAETERHASCLWPDFSRRAPARSSRRIYKKRERRYGGLGSPRGRTTSVQV